MRSATTKIVIALFASTLAAACGGTGGDSPTVASHIARAVTRTVDLTDGSTETIGHVVTATVLSDFAKKCEEEAAKPGTPAVSELEAELRPPQCPLVRRNNSNLTRI